MSEIHFFNRSSGSLGTAAVRALDKSAQTHNNQQHARDERIAELKRQYEAGTYVVDTVQLSAAVLTDLLTQS